MVKSRVTLFGQSLIPNEDKPEVIGEDRRRRILADGFDNSTEFGQT